MEAMYERPRVGVKVERGSTCTFTSDFLYIRDLKIEVGHFTANDNIFGTLDSQVVARGCHVSIHFILVEKFSSKLLLFEMELGNH